MGEAVAVAKTKEPEHAMHAVLGHAEARSSARGGVHAAGSVLGGSERETAKMSVLDRLVNARTLAHLEGKKAVEPAFLDELRTNMLSMATFGASRVPAAIRAARDGRWEDFTEQVAEMGLSLADSKELYELVLEHSAFLEHAVGMSPMFSLVATVAQPISMLAGSTIAWIRAIEAGRQAYARERYAMQFAATMVQAIIYNEPVGSFTDDEVGVIARTHGRSDAYACLRTISEKQVKEYREALLADAGSAANLRAAIIDRVRESAGVEGVVTHSALGSEVHR